MYLLMEIITNIRLPLEFRNTEKNDCLRDISHFQEVPTSVANSNVLEDRMCSI